MGETLTFKRCVFILCSKGRRRPREKFSEHGQLPQLIAQKPPCCGLDLRKSGSMEQKGHVNAQCPLGRALIQSCSVEWSPGIFPLLANVPAWLCKAEAVKLHVSGSTQDVTFRKQWQRCHLQHLLTRQLCCDTDLQCSSPISHHVLSPHLLGSVGVALPQKGSALGDGAGNPALYHKRHELEDFDGSAMSQSHGYGQ